RGDDLGLVLRLGGVLLPAGDPHHVLRLLRVPGAGHRLAGVPDGVRRPPPVDAINPKSETRNPKQTRNPKKKIRNPRPSVSVIGILGLGFVSDFEFRISDFGCHYGSRQTRMVPSPLPETACRPSGRNATAVTESVCPVKCRSSARVSTSHRRSTKSSPPESA